MGLGELWLGGHIGTQVCSWCQTFPDLAEREENLGPIQEPGNSSLIPRTWVWECDLFPILYAQPQPEMIQCHGLKYFQIVAAAKKAKAGDQQAVFIRAMHVIVERMSVQ